MNYRSNISISQYHYIATTLCLYVINILHLQWAVYCTKCIETGYSLIISHSDVNNYLGVYSLVRQLLCRSSIVYFSLVTRLIVQVMQHVIPMLTSTSQVPVFKRSKPKMLCWLQSVRDLLRNVFIVILYLLFYLTLTCCAYFCTYQ